MPPSRRRYFSPAEVLCALSAYVERHTPSDGPLARLAGIDTRYDGNQRWRLRMHCEHHGIQVPEAHRCPVCVEPELGEAIVITGPRDYAAYLLDGGID